jgi:hypothetical protein
MGTRARPRESWAKADLTVSIAWAMLIALLTSSLEMIRSFMAGNRKAVPRSKQALGVL